MPKPWTGKLIGDMHNNRITYDALAAELGVTKSYISMVLNCKREPADAEKKFRAAYAAIIQREKDTTLDV